MWKTQALIPNVNHLKFYIDLEQERRLVFVYISKLEVCAHGHLIQFFSHAPFISFGQQVTGACWIHHVWRKGLVI